MKRPSFQFYPGDWQSNSNLRRCTHAEKGAWVDVLCLMHDQPEYGILRWPLAEIIRAIGAQGPHVKALVSKDVLKGDDKLLAEPVIYIPRSGRRDGNPVILLDKQPGPIWYSSRMVKDEYVRTIRGESSRFGADNGDTPKVSPKPPFGDGSSSSSSSSSSSEDSRRGEAPPVGSLKTQIYRLAKQLDIAAGVITTELQAHSETEVWKALGAALAAKPAEALPYFRACLKDPADSRFKSA